MTEAATEQPVIRRVMVALDTSPPSVEALAAAVRLAAGLKAELRGVFVEDSELLDLPALPFIREVQAVSARAHEFDAARLACELRGLAERARGLLAEQARAAGVSWSFTTQRGRVAHALLSAAADADLVTLGCSGFRRPAGRRFGSTARAFAERLPHPLLLMHRGDAMRLPVCVLQGTTPTAARARDTAERVAAALGEPRQVVPLAVRTAPRAAAAARACGAGLVVAAADAPALAGDGLQSLFDGLHCALLLVPRVAAGPGTVP